MVDNLTGVSQMFREIGQYPVVSNKELALLILIEFDEAF